MTAQSRPGDSSPQTGALTGLRYAPTPRRPDVSKASGQLSQHFPARSVARNGNNRYWIAPIGTAWSRGKSRGFSALLALSLAACQIETASVEVIDGDTLRLGTPPAVRVRLDGIDAPERDQTCLGADALIWDCGKAATAHLRGLVAGKSVECETTGYDQYGRTVASCSVADTDGVRTDLGAAMVLAGLAIDVARYSRGRYRAAEMVARAGRRGIWAGQFDTPKHWRATHRSER